MTGPCPNCRERKAAGQYLCRDCWGQLPPATRTALYRRGNGAIGRLQQLYDEIAAGTPLRDIRIE